jgi:hypothetical protein
MDSGGSGDTYNIIGNSFSGGQNQLGGEHNTITTAMTITADIIKSKLKECGVSRQDIEIIEPEIADIGAECDKEMGNMGEIKVALSKIKDKLAPAVSGMAVSVISTVIAKALGL